MVVTVNVDVAMVPETRVTLLGLRVAVGGLETKHGSLGGVQSPGFAYTLTAKLTVPEKPFRLVSVIVDVVEWRLATVRLVGLAVMLKSAATDCTFIFAIHVAHAPFVWFPYSPETQTVVGSDGSSPAPK